jgi:hypothetical protein
MTRLLRALVGLALAVGGVVLLAPTELPSSTPLTEPSDLATAMATFALRVLATSFCGYLALVLLALVLLEARLLPGALRRSVERWTARGLAGAVRQVIGASVLAVGVLPMSSTAAHAAELPTPVLAPMEEPPVPTVPSASPGPPRMTPDRPARPLPTVAPSPPARTPTPAPATTPDDPPRMVPLHAPDASDPTAPSTPSQPPPMAPAAPAAPPSTTPHGPPRMAPLDAPDVPTPAARSTPSSTPATSPPTAPQPDRPAPRVEHPRQHPSRSVLPRTPPRSRTTLVVQAGDSFWSITEDLVTLRLGRQPTDKEVIGPWLDLIARNTQVLADPDDPDLLHPGAVLHLPPGRVR